jgi:hypothetical protein
MIADEPRPTPAVGAPDATVLNADAFHREIVAFIERELPVWRDRPNRPPLTDEPNLNQTLCVHLNSSSRRQCFDAVQFLQEPIQSSGRRGDIGVMPLGLIVVEGRAYDDFEQLLPIECKRLPTPPDNRRSDLEYVHGLPGHRTGAIERFKHGLHGRSNRRALIIGYVQAESFQHWLSVINARLALLAKDGTDAGHWNPAELLSSATGSPDTNVNKLISSHGRLVPPCCSSPVEIEHLWLRMN